jgi:hypothetical protein
VDAELNLRELGYQELLLPLLGSNVTIAHDAQLGDYYISGSVSGTTRTYTLTETGLYEHGHAPTSAFFLSGGVVGVYESLSGFSDLDVRTDTIDFGTRAMKTIHSIEVGSTVAANLQVRVYFRADSGAAWKSTALLSLNNEGKVDFLVSGVEFQVQVYSSDYTSFDRMDYIKLNWRADGPRNLRGSLLT